MKLFIIFLLFLSSSSFACKLDTEALRSPVWYNGQVKSFQVSSFFTIKHLFKKTSLKKASEFYCYLLTQDEDTVRNTKMYKSSDIDFYKEIPNLPRIFNLANKIELKEDRDKALSRFEKIRMFRELIHGKEMMVFENTWKPLVNFDQLNVKKLSSILKRSKNSYGDKKYLFENYLHEFKIVSFSFYTLLISFLFLFIPFKKNESFFNAAVLTSFLLQAVVIILRLAYTQRAPISNMYETVLLAGPLALLFGLITYRKNRLVFRFSAIFCLATLGTAYFSTHMLDSEIKNLMPVLRDNFWLSTHVTTIMLGYSILGISWILANYILVHKILNKNIDAKNVDDAIILSLKYGVFFLFLGILLGAIWADYSWGRFWAWDPKETWSLIAFLVYMVLFHGIRARIFPKDLIHCFVSASFMAILIAWFGVNFVLASGLHTYGFSYGGTLFLSTIILLQFGIIFKYSVRRKLT